ncbi:DUF3224 domain-containing protein [Sphingomonas sp. HMP6]|uniref:DUF3224 domain-containing protein n=1 Tax=Sphingomonas sp. HMP6 TaxID=1517551 RepID=UPI001597872B|nr:DUF3224 domain-containing protein [Sphingomonas sp. HMP6]BCA60023.1 hypothetical protein HMP06_2792 [Sphingomonas sp. HMP6]
MRPRWLLLTPLALIAAAAAPERTPMHHATGTFEVKMTPEAQGDAPADGLPTSRMAIAKTFIGGMTGTATGTMLAAGTPQPGHPAGYVAIDQFSGSVDGKAGSFLLLHRGTIDKAGGAELSVIIAPDSGTGALEGIAGTFEIKIEGGKHEYDLAYTLPAA